VAWAAWVVWVVWEAWAVEGGGEELAVAVAESPSQRCGAEQLPHDRALQTRQARSRTGSSYTFSHACLPFFQPFLQHPGRPKPSGSSLPGCFNIS
jgi:hypothetical protein